MTRQEQIREAGRIVARVHDLILELQKTSRTYNETTSNIILAPGATVLHFEDEGQLLLMADIVAILEELKGLYSIASKLADENLLSIFRSQTFHCGTLLMRATLAREQGLQLPDPLSVTRKMADSLMATLERIQYEGFEPGSELGNANPSA